MSDDLKRLRQNSKKVSRQIEIKDSVSNLIKELKEMTALLVKTFKGMYACKHMIDVLLLYGQILVS